MPSIDGKKYKGTLTIKYGEDFIKKGTHKLVNDEQGIISAWVFEVGTPYWNKDYTVTMPIRYMITEIHEPSKKYKHRKKRKETGLSVVK